MRRLVLLVIALSIAAALVFAEQRREGGRVGLSAVMRLVADFERQVERIPLTATRVSDAEETDVGKRLAQNYSLLKTDPDLERVGKRIAGRAERKGISYHFYLLEQPGFVNAFALPGGHIVVGRGLLDLIGSEDELAAIIGHEIAHVDRRHAIERLQYELAARKLGLSLPYALAALPVTVFHAGYTKELELEADRVGVSLAAAAGHPPEAAIAMLTRLEKQSSEQQAHARTPGEEAGRIVTSGLVEYLRTHPPATERIAEIRKEIAMSRLKR